LVSKAFGNDQQLRRVLRNMAIRILTDEQRARYGRFTGTPTPDRSAVTTTVYISSGSR
jgi:hypothetical protein